MWEFGVELPVDLRMVMVMRASRFRYATSGANQAIFVFGQVYFTDCQNDKSILGTNVRATVAETS